MIRVVLAIAAALVAACDGGPTRPDPTPPPKDPPVLLSSATALVGAGDIAVCGSAGTDATAAMLDGIGGIVFTAGDNAYQHGNEANFRDCYDPTWGRHKARTRPAPGNHEYETSGAAPYFAYFGANAGPPGLGYYSFDAGSWHIVSLNSNIPAGQGSSQYEWLRTELSRRAARCTGAIWHHPLFSSGQNGPASIMRDVWRLLHQAGAEFVIAGHEHLYERFAPLDATGRPAADGLRQFIAGTGGAPLYQFVTIAQGSEVRVSSWGLLRLTLRSDNYAWEFLAVGGSVRDQGTAACR